jgi:formylglycine-generating enzyme required for sulfatase activity
MRTTTVFVLVFVLAGAVRADLPDGKEHTNSIGMKLVRIEAGAFTMGQGDGPPKSRTEWLQRDWDEAPAHKVKITKPFFMGVHEVTNAEYEQFDPKHKQLRGQDGVSKADDEPVTFVTWQQAGEFCAWLSKKEGKPYRLPTEAEWEYGCRAGTTTLYSTGDTITAIQANAGNDKDGKAITTVPVGTYKANPWGLHDMHGNVAEWCLDWYGPYLGGGQSDPVGRADGEARVVRGWSFLPSTQPNTRYLRSANRSGLLPEDANRATGFRIVLGELPKTKPLAAVVQHHQKDVKQSPAPKDGPDPAKPLFIDYAKADKGPKTVFAEVWGPVFSQWNHFSAVCVCPNGDVLAAWYTTVQEAGRECSQAISRLRAGADTWEPVSSFLTIPDVNCHAPVLFTDGKRIYHFFTQSLKGWDNSSNSMRYSDDNGATWSKPRIILPRTDPDALSQPCSCIKTKDGTLVVACDGDLHKDERFLVSKDDGKTWKVTKGDMRKSAAGRYVIHPAIFERADGTILTYLRGPQPMPVALTKDLGDTFTVEETKFPGISSGMKTAVLKLHSGAVLLCSIDRTKELVGGGTFAALSLDDGKTWPHIKKVEGAGGYMSLAQAPNGVIYLNGTQLKIVAFNEKWVKTK